MKTYTKSAAAVALATVFISMFLTTTTAAGVAARAPGIATYAAEAPLPAGAGGPPGGAQLEAVTCPTGGGCVAVGINAFEIAALPAVYTETSGKWRAQLAPAPLADASTAVTFRAIACPSVGDCVAVGEYSTVHTSQQGFILFQKAGKWTAVEAPIPADEGTDPQAGLDEVACAGAGSCVALGTYVDAKGLTEPLVVDDSNGTWTLATLPLPSNGYPGVGFEPSALTCTAGGRCHIAGPYPAMLDGGWSGSGVAAWTQEGRAWAPAILPLPANASSQPVGADLQGLSCPTASSCTAVGSYLTAGSDQPVGLVESEVDGTWTGTETPLPPQLPSDTMVRLGAVSCTSTSCEVLGSYFVPGPTTGILALTGSGTSWTASTPSLPQGFSRTWEPVATAVDCSGTAQCAGYGTYYDNSGAPHDYLVALSSGTGTAADVPTPSQGSFGQVAGIACAPAGDCVAVGTYFLSAEAETRGLVLRLSGSDWLPRAAPFALTDPHAVLDQVACGAPDACTFVGSFVASTGHQEPMAMSRDSGTWQLESIPRSSTSDSNGGTFTGLACPLQGSCTAVGNGLQAGPGAFVTEQVSGTWRMLAAPIPPGGTQSSSSLSGLYCRAAATCVAVGGYVTTTGVGEGLIETETAGRWTVAQAPVPAGAATNPEVWLSSVSCQPAECVAVGNYRDPQANTDGLVLVESGGHWRAFSVVPEAGGTINAAVTIIRSVSCPPAGPCTAVGQYYPGPGQDVEAVVVRGSGATWGFGLAPAPPTVPAGNAQLYFVSCEAAGCDAVGTYGVLGANPFAWFLRESASGTWTSVEGPGSVYPTALGCASPGNCEAAARGAVMVEAHGSWTSATAPVPQNGTGNPANFQSVGCSTGNVCDAVGSYLETGFGIKEALVVASSL